MQKLRKNNRGFTIIEVLIVLAIAGLIMLIVFLAVPALQRNARNTQRKNDVGKLLAAASDFVSNNNGTLPTTTFCFGDAVLQGPTGTQQATATLGYYCKGSAVVAWTTGTANPNDVDRLWVRTGVKCDGTTGDAIAGSSRGIVALYTLENGVKQCQES